MEILKNRRQLIRVGVSGLLLSFAWGKVLAQSVSSLKHTRPIRMIIPYPPGGAGDIVGRMFAPKLSEALEQTIVIDNKGGGGQMIATELAAKSPADGYTLFLASTTHGINPGLHKTLPYDTLNDFAPITMVASSPLMWVVHPSLGINHLKDLVNYASANPGKLNYGSAGPGSGGHLASELFKYMAKIDMVHTPYKGTGPALTDLLSNQIQVMCTSPLPLMPHIKAGKLKALAVTSAKRSNVMPELPTVAESGYPDYQASLWYALLVPAKTPLPMQEYIYQATMKTLKSNKELVNLFAEQGADIIASTPSDTQKFLREEIVRWTRAISNAKISID